MIRRTWDANVKASIVLEGLQGKPIADLCSERKIDPSQYYHWRDQFLANASKAFWDANVKASIVLEGLQGKPIADLCSEYQIDPSQYHHWRDQFLANASKAFEERQRSLRSGPQDTVAASDDVIGLLYVIIGAAFAFFLGWFYWRLHGGSLDKFAFWSTGDTKWLEVLFWSLFTTNAWNITEVAIEMGNRSFRKRYALEFLGRTFEAPPVSLALVFLLVNIGVTFGSTTISLKDVPMEAVIAFSIISAFFSKYTIEGLQAVARFLKRALSLPRSRS